MNKSKVIILLVVLNVLLVGICLNFSNKNILLNNEKQIVKEMTQSENEANLQTQINQLNASHKEYASNVQTYKKQIAEAVTNQGVSTSENDEASVIAENINKILEVGTKIDDSVAATADNITKGKKAWVNGNLITGTGVDNDAYYEEGSNIEISGYSPQVTQSNKCENYISYRGSPYVFQEDYKYVIVSLVVEETSYGDGQMAYSTISEGTYLGGCKDWNSWNGCLSVMVYEDVPKNASLYVNNCGSYAITFIKK